MSGLIFYMHDGPSTFRFELAGNLAGNEVAKLAQAWQTASSTIKDKILAIDVTFLKSTDEKGRELLTRWSRAGAHFIANSTASRTLIESITGNPYSTSDAAVGPTFEPRFAASAFRTILIVLTFLTTLLFPSTASASSPLKQQTLDAWEQYLQTATVQMLDRAKGTFLWLDESPDRVRRAHDGEVIVEPMERNPKSVAEGLIHHWIGATFIPGARINDVLAVVRNYDNYTEFYKPSVVDAKTLSSKAKEDRFSVVVVDKAMFMKRALDSEYQSRFTQVDTRRWFSFSRTTRVQEVAGDRRIPDGEGSGYIWRLSTISRYQERDGGVYIETEAMALSRPIPATLHWVVAPIVRRVSRASLTMTLEQTRDATGSLVKSASAITSSRKPKSAGE